MFFDNLVDKSVCVLLLILENLGTRSTSSNVIPSLMLKWTSYQRMKNRYKPFLVFFNILFAIFKISFAAPTLCVRRISAPYIIEISSAAIVP